MLELGHELLAELLQRLEPAAQGGKGRLVLLAAREEAGSAALGLTCLASLGTDLLGLGPGAR